MAPLDLPPVVFWLPSKPAVIRPADDLIKGPDLAALKINNLVYGGGPQVPFDLSFINSYTSTAGTNPMTISGADLGDPEQGRHILVALGTGGGGAHTFDSATIAGVAATIHIQVGTSESQNCAIFGATVPSGSSGDIVCTFEDARVFISVGVYRMVGHSSATPTGTDQAQSSGSNPETNTITIQAGGAAISSFSIRDNAGTPATAWTNLTEDFDHANVANNDSHSGASDTFATLQSGRTITAQSSTSPQELFLCTAAWK